MPGDGLFTADTAQPNWAKAHNILMPPFGNRAMQTYHPMMVDIAQQLCLKWERLNDDEDIDVVHDMTALTLDTIGLCGFDYRFNSFYRRDYHPYVEAMVRSLETAMLVRGLPFEDLLLRNRHKTFAQDVVFMNEMVDQIVAERRDNAQASQKDLLGAMLSGVDRNTGTQLDDVNIRYQINTFLIAGHETTSGLLSYAIYAMLKNPEIMAKAVAETDRVLGANVATAPTYSQVVQLTYITQILKEALRLWPPAPAFSLAPLKDEVIGGQYKLKKGAFINILVPSLHRDPAVWGPRAEVFDPENFTAEAEAKRPANAWKPFGNGQRACIGRGFAMHEAALALGLILQRFTLVDHQRYQLKTKETLTIKPDGFKIKVRMREGREHTPVPVSLSTAPPTHAGATPARVAQRPSHGTKLLVLYGSNLGTAEELAHRLAETAEVNGFETTLGAMDDYAGKLPQDGALVIICASYNGAPPDNASKFIAWLDASAPADAAKGVRFTVFGCGNREWAATYQSVPRHIDERLAALGGERVFERGEGDARDDLDGQYESLVREAGSCRGAGLWHRDWVRPRHDDGAALRRRNGADGRCQPGDRGGERAGNDGARHPRTAGAQRRRRFGTLDETYRHHAAGRDDLPRWRSSVRRAAQRSGAGRRNRAALWIDGRHDGASCRECRTASATPGRRADHGRSAARAVPRSAGRRDAQGDRGHGRAHALPDDAAETARARRRRRGRLRALSRGGAREATIDLRPSGRASGV